MRHGGPCQANTGFATRHVRPVTRSLACVTALQLPSRDRLETLLVSSLRKLPSRAQLLLAGARPVRIDGQQLEPEVQLLLTLMKLSGRSSFEALPVQEARAEIRREAALYSGAPIPIRTVEDIEVTGAAGPLRARLYVPDVLPSPAPLVVYYHGGGWVVGDLDTHDPVCRCLARATDAAVLSVDYRLAPEHRFPAAVDDALAAFRWAAARRRTRSASTRRASPSPATAPAATSRRSWRRSRRARAARPARAAPHLSGDGLLEEARLVRDLRRGLLPRPRRTWTGTARSTSPDEAAATTRAPRRSSRRPRAASRPRSS